MSRYQLEECTRKGYLHEADRPETREKLCFRPKHQPHKPGGATSTGHIHQLRDFNGRKQEQVGVGHTIRTQCIQRAEDPGGISGYCRRHHWSSLGESMVC